MTEQEVCPLCAGTGNAGHSGHVDEYGCIRCGGAGYLDWRNDLARVIFVVLVLAFMAWLFLFVGPGK